MSSTATIRHPLKLTVANQYLSNDQVGDCDDGYTWPAAGRDNGWNTLGGNSEYIGGVDELCMGSLLALPENYNCGALGASTTVEYRICVTLRNFGAYVVDIHPDYDDNIDQNYVSIAAEWGTFDTMHASAADIVTAVNALMVVADQDETHKGGVGNRIHHPAHYTPEPLGN